MVSGVGFAIRTVFGLPETSKFMLKDPGLCWTAWLPGVPLACSAVELCAIRSNQQIMSVQLGNQLVVAYAKTLSTASVAWRVLQIRLHVWAMLLGL